MNGILPQPRRPRRRLWTAAVFGMLVAGVPFADALTTRGEIYPGVIVADLALGGKSAAEARRLLGSRIDAFEATPLTFTLNHGQATIPAGELLTVDPEETLARAWSVGRAGQPTERIATRFKTRLSSHRVEPAFAVDTSGLASKLSEKFAPSLPPAPKDAAFAIEFKENTVQITIVPEQEGRLINTEVAAAELMNEARQLSSNPIALATVPISPSIQTSDLEKVRPALQKMLARPDLTVRAENTSWVVSADLRAGWIMPVKEGDAPRLTFSRARIKQWLQGKAKEVERAPQEAIFELTNDGLKVKKFQIGKPGMVLPIEENVSHIEQALLEGTPSVELAFQETLPATRIAHGAELYGIRELVGRATTNFKGSPRNRVKNIKRGSEILNGTLIKPGQEFSLLDALRPFTTKNGYLAELVIKAAENKTVPEIGGGLCQIGTTMFRTVLNAGLPVTARRNHSYRVSYYEPPIGMDATIYDPAPDFKFLNDTGGWLMLLTRVEGSEVTFELWGTKDGRNVAISTPEVSNIRKPPEKKVVETTELPVGKIKCTEKPHVGSDARFTYKVTYADGRIEEQEFKSRYRPWQEVCLVGVAPVAAAPPAASTTPTETAPSETLPSADVVGVVGAPDIIVPEVTAPQGATTQ